MGRLLLPMSMLSLLSIGAMFGVFYAWICSTMWGLDAIDPKIALAAMQAMNASVRNAVFFPAFFLTPFILAATAFIAARQKRHRSALLLAGGAVIYFAGAFVVTVTINVPMNEALAEVVVPTDIEAARSLWQAYSPEWQFWNTLRTIVSGASFILTGLSVYYLNSENT
ncbi:DUF1772 domain-containing protein [Rhodobacteraceae bacterium 63075]|nr:DUF1772 domain-containing protein [Rhodobacteraceae bacterium 63075]